MLKKSLLFLSLTLLCSSTAFAEDAPKQISFDMEFEVDGKTNAKPVMTTAEGAPLSFESQCSEQCPAYSELKLDLVPKLSGSKVKLKGTLVVAEGEKKPKSVKVDTAVVNGQTKWLKFRVNKHVYRFKIAPKF